MLRRSLLAAVGLAAVAAGAWIMAGAQTDRPVIGAQTLASADREPVDASVTYREQMKLTQETLRSFGYAPGAINGIMRFETAAALRAFQREQGLQVTGQANPETLAALGIKDRLYRRPR